MRFLELFKAAGFVCQPDEADEKVTAFMERFAGRAEGGVLNDWPPEVLSEMTVGLVIRLAKQARELSPAVLTEMAERVWEAVRARD